MKEFEKKGNPSREPTAEGMKGLSKFLPMTDSNYRRRLTEYEVQVQDLQAYVRSLEAETGRLRKKMDEAPKEFMVLENKLREANRQLVQAFNQNEKLVNALYEAREQITSLKEEVDGDGGLRDPGRGRGPQGAARRAPRRGHAAGR